MNNSWDNDGAIATTMRILRGSWMGPSPTVSVSRQRPAQYGGLPEIWPAGASKPQPAGETSVARAGDGKQLKNSVQCGAYPSFCRISSLVLSDRQLPYGEGDHDGGAVPAAGHLRVDLLRR